MSLFGSLMGDVEEDQFFGSHMRHMRQMNNMMNSMMSSMFSDPFGSLGGGGPLSITCPRSSGALMPFMPQMPSLNRLFPGDLDGHMSAGHSFSSSTVYMSNGPNGKPQVISSSSSTKIGPNGIKETRKTLQDSRTGTKKMSIGHHIGERAHVIEREQNVYSGDAEEHQEFINLDEDEAEDFDREFQQKAGSSGSRAAIAAPRRSQPRLALPAPPAHTAHNSSVSEERRVRPTARRPLRTSASPLTTHSSSVRDVYGSAAPMCPRRSSKPSHASHKPSADH